MNRQTKRLMQRQGQIEADGSPAQKRREAPVPSPGRAGRGAGSGGSGGRWRPGEFARDVRSELRKVAWPTRAETINYSTVVLLSLVLLIAVIAFLDWGFASAVLKLFKV